MAAAASLSLFLSGLASLNQPAPEELGLNRFLPAHIESKLRLNFQDIRSVVETLQIYRTPSLIGANGWQRQRLLFRLELLC